MLCVGHIQVFIKQLRSYPERTDYDEAFLTSLSERIHSCSDKAILDEKMRDFIINLFRQRWEKIADTSADYTINPRGINLHWIALAKQLAQGIVAQSYLQILIPAVRNKIDHNLLTPLSDCDELGAFYLGEDGKTLYRVRGIFELTKRRVFHKGKKIQVHPFSTYSKSTASRALSLRELLRIRAKCGADLSFIDSGKRYDGFWSYLKKEVIPDLPYFGSKPRYLLPSLLQWIEFYLEGNHADFRANFFIWMHELQRCKMSDINHLYGQVIQVGDDRYYLLDILLDCLQEAPSLDVKLRGVAKWLCLYDASFTSSSEPLQDVYKSLSSGAHFGIADLKKLLQKITSKTSEVRTETQALLKMLKSKPEFSAAVVKRLKKLYQQRWDAVKGTDKDYTQLQDGENSAWILLAQKLSGAGLIEMNYYRFLMPTLTEDLDPVSTEKITSFPLSHCILSEDGRALIPLEHSVRHYQSKRTFYNCTSYPPKPFTEIECARIKKAHLRFHKYLRMMEESSPRHDPPLELDTILALKQLLDGSLYPNGLWIGFEYTESEMTRAEQAYQVFFKFLADLPEEEQRNLNAQKIIYGGQIKYFSEVMENIVRGECIATQGRYLAQLLMDYAPYLRFSDEVEEKYEIDLARAHANKKMCVGSKDPDSVISKRIESLFVSLMSSQFGYLLDGKKVAVSLLQNVIPKELEPILHSMVPMLEAGDKKQAYEVYAKIMDVAIRPPLADASWTTYLIRSTATKAWLMSVVDKSLFAEAPECLSPELIIRALLPLAYRNTPVRKQVELFMDSLLKTRLQPISPWMQSLCINVEYRKFLNSLTASQQNQIQILIAHEKTNAPLSDVQMNQHCIRLLVHRLARLGSGADGFEHAGFFSQPSYGKIGRYQGIKKALVSKLTPESHSYHDLMDELHRQLADLLASVPAERDASKVIRYWQDITSRELPAERDVAASMVSMGCG